MPTEDILYYLSSKNKIQKLKLQLAMNCAPFLKGLKKACIIMLTEDQADQIIHLMKKTNISFYRICTKKSKEIVFLYRKESMMEYLRDQEIQSFLREYGYEGNSLEDYIYRLQVRISTYYNERDTFPHEIGAFLDYPIDDIKGFIEQEGKNYQVSGYWKVYHNPEEAKKLFASYDKAKEVAVREILAGREIEEIAC